MPCRWRSSTRIELGAPDPSDKELNIAFVPARHVFSGEQPELVRFEFNAKNIDKAALNEDGPLDDEVYAKLRLTNDRTPPAVLTKISNVITGEFAERRVG